jgi:hypothetical protein
LVAGYGLNGGQWEYTPNLVCLLADNLGSKGRLMFFDAYIFFTSFLFLAPFLFPLAFSSFFSSFYFILISSSSKSVVPFT